MKTGIKKTIAFALTLCAISAGTIAPNARKLSLSPTPIVASAATKVGDFTFTRRSTNAATLTSYVGSATIVTLPTKVTINGTVCTVSGIDENAFAFNTTIKSVTIPSGYTSIGDSSFRGCTNLTSVSIPSSIVAIRNYAFQNTGITSVSLPAAIKMLGDGAFNMCYNLKTATMKANKLTALPDNLFGSCSSLTSFTIPSNIKKIGAGAFSYCRALKSVSIPSGVTSIDNYAFNSCTSLSSVTLPSTVTTLGDGVFSYCSNLSSISVPSSVTNFGEKVFDNTPWLKNHAKTNLLIIHNNVVLDGSSATRNVGIPSGVKSIAGGAFAQNKSIQQVTMPSSVTNIGNRAFEGCTNLATVSLSSSLKAIPDGCFSGCKYLRTINFPNSIETVGSLAFDACENLRSFRFPNNLKKIDGYAFRNCKLLSEITNVNTSKNYDIHGYAFQHCLALKKINGQLFVSHPSTGTIKFYNEAFTKKYFSQIGEVGLIQDFLDYKSSDVVAQIKSAHPGYNSVQLSKALEEWMCANGRSPFDKWKAEHGNTNYPEDIEEPDEYHCESAVLLNGIGVCEGWAKSYNLLLQKAGIWAEVVSSANHSWNVVYMDGKWFNIDSYWDDNGSSSKHTYFMVSSDEIYALEKKNNDNRHCHNQIFVNRKSNGYFIDYTEDIPCTTPMGDVNIDGKLDTTDINWLTYYIKNKKDPDKWFNHVCADLNFDGQINNTDLTLLKNKINNK